MMNDIGEPIAERIFCGGSSSAKRTASSLIPPARPKPLRRGEGPAFSPLRGEGVALGAPAKSNVLLRAGRQSTFMGFR